MVHELKMILKVFTYKSYLTSFIHIGPFVLKWLNFIQTLGALTLSQLDDKK